ncbi:protein of unknown function DUF669 [Oleidesulfovibrio alaskensis G20]|jgi:hypothetical protein|uniref:DUF669 domain-containing protein n=1 Tax=Oleidesulfovibrio alaskensis (strain ATCC BAA-1058 / DSM 17464 / G20) TaxID=207559 RepID=Q314E1_OLEA2|nr:DUF669 domain-containing protein [Oleidesulfovibrio alaskensis]ABB37705.1 protein of unknown function DUF669 [Oleidesulfovibrio alaskensis G20]
MSWNNDDTMDLAQFDDDFVSADVEEKDFEAVPDGKYQVKVDRVELTRSETSGNPMLKWALKILGPTHKGRLLWRNNVIASKDNVKWLKQDLYTCGLQMDKLSDLPGKLETLLDVGLEVTKRTKNEFENIYFNRRIVLSDEDAAAPSTGHDVDDMIPF